MSPAEELRRWLDHHKAIQYLHKAHVRLSSEMGYLDDEAKSISKGITIAALGTSKEYESLHVVRPHPKNPWIERAAQIIREEKDKQYPPNGAWHCPCGKSYFLVAAGACCTVCGSTREQTIGKTREDIRERLESELLATKRRASWLLDAIERIAR